MVRWRFSTRARPETEASTSEADRIARARHDPGEFNALLTERRDDVYRFCLHRLGDRDQAEDATQETLIRAIAGFNAFEVRSEGSFRAWIVTIAVNVLKDDAKRRKLLTQPMPEAATFPDPNPTPEELAIQASVLTSFHGLISRLPEAQRLVMELLSADLNATEIGVVLDKKPDHVRQIRKRANANLLALWRGEYGGEDV